MHYAGVKNYELLEKLIEQISDEKNSWNIACYYQCFCGNANKMLDVPSGGISEVLYDAGSDYEDFDYNFLQPLLLPGGYNDESEEAQEKFSRENAVRVLKDIRDKGYYSW